MSRLATFAKSAVAALAVTVVQAGPAAAAEKVNFVLNWVPGGDHAPVYWAKEQGWYDKVGIDLVIENGTGSGAS
ncbi:MAG: ABC transporter substrate-binding protein, partial [Rhodospirillaceae bacterium]